MNRSFAHAMLAANLFLCACGVSQELGAQDPDDPALFEEEGIRRIATAAIKEARTHIGVVESPANSDCNKFSKGLGRPCEEWCADFVNYVWKKAGADVSGLSAASISFYSYAKKNGGWKEGADNKRVKAGDGVIWGKDHSWGEHIGMVTEVLSDGRLRVIHGNWHDGGNGRVYEGVITRRDQVGTGAPILGFASLAR